jgi:hypothetical protein
VGGMSESIKARSSDFKLLYDGTDISADIAKDVESLEYTDNASDTSDSISIVVNASDSKWINGWLPDEGAELHLKLSTQNWEAQGDRASLDCGLMVLDDLGFSDEPAKLTLGAVAKPNDTDFSEQDREYTWKNTSIKKIAETIGARYGLAVKFDGEDMSLTTKDQDATDSAFLQKLCSTYGLILKVYNKRLWIYDREKYKKKAAVATIRKTDMVRGSFHWNTSLSGTYTGGEFTYTKQSENINISVKIGTGPRIKKLNQYAANEADARRQLQAAIDSENHGHITISFSMPGKLALAAAQCINVTGRGKLDGKYFIDSVNHKKDRSSGLVSEFSCSKVLN